MLIEKKESTAQMTEDIVQNSIGVKSNSVGFLVNLLSTKMYKNRREAFLREILSNAIDSNSEAQSDNPVLLRIYIGEDTNLHIQIRDYGVGLSPERFQDVYLNIASSTKANDNTQQGGFGIGKFAAISYATYASISSFHKGIRYEYAMYHDGDSTSVPKLGEAPTDEPNGVLVDISFENLIDVNHSQYVELLEIFNSLLTRISYIPNVFVDLDINQQDVPIIADTKDKYAFEENFGRLQKIVEVINSNIVIRKEHFTFSVNAFKSNLYAENYKQSNIISSLLNFNVSVVPNKSLLHIVVGGNVHYPLDLNKLEASYYPYKLNLLERLESTEGEEQKHIKNVLNVIDDLSFYSLKDIYLTIPVGINIPIGFLDILPSREEFIYNQKTSFKIFDLLFFKVLPDLEEILIDLNFKNYNSYEQYLEEEKIDDNYTIFGQNSNSSLTFYENVEEKIKVKVNYSGNFTFVKNSDSSKYIVHHTLLNSKQCNISKYFKTILNTPQLRSSRVYCKIAIRVKGSKDILRVEVPYPSSASSNYSYEHVPFKTIKGEPIPFKHIYNLENIYPLYKEKTSFESLFLDSKLLSKLSVKDFLNRSSYYTLPYIINRGKISKAYAKTTNSLTDPNEKYGSTVNAAKIYNNVANKSISHLDLISLSNSSIIVAEPNKLNPLQKAYLIDSVANHKFHASPHKYLGYVYGENIPVSVISPQDIKSFEEFKAHCNDVHKFFDLSWIEVRDLVQYPNPTVFMREKIAENKNKQFVLSLRKKVTQRIKEVTKKHKEYVESLVKKSDLVHKELEVINDSKYLEQYKSLPEAEYNRQAELVELLIQEKKKERSDLQLVIKDTKALITSISKGIEEKHFTEVIKSKNIVSRKTDEVKKIENQKLVLRDSSIFKESDIKQTYLKFFEVVLKKIYDKFVSTVFVDFTQVTEVPEDFEEEFLNQRAKEKELQPTSEKGIVNVRVLSYENYKYDSEALSFQTLKLAPEAFYLHLQASLKSMKKFSQRTNFDSLFKNITFVYGNLGKTKVTEKESLLANAFKYVATNSSCIHTTIQDQLKRMFTSYGNEKVTNFIFLDIAITRQKHFEQLPNFIHVDKFVENMNQYKSIKRLNSVLNILDQYPQFLYFAKVIEKNSHIFNVETVSKIKRLANIVEKEGNNLNSRNSSNNSYVGFRKQMLEKAKIENSFDYNIDTLFDSCKNELAEMDLILACNQDSLRSTFNTTNTLFSSSDVPLKDAFDKNLKWNFQTKGSPVYARTTISETNYRNSVEELLVHPIVTDLLVQVLKDKKNIRPSYQACNRSIQNLNILKK